MIIVDLNDGGLHYTKNKQKSLNIEIKDSYGVSNLSGWYSKSDPGSIEMYIGASRNSYKYSESDFAMTVAHEFGHALGIGDLYNDSGIPIKFPAMMNNQWEVKGKAQQVDYAMMLKAQKEDKWQRWSENTDLLDELGILYK